MWLLPHHQFIQNNLNVEWLKLHEANGRGRARDGSSCSHTHTLRWQSTRWLILLYTCLNWASIYNFCCIVAQSRSEINNFDARMFLFFFALFLSSPCFRFSHILHTRHKHGMIEFGSSTSYNNIIHSFQKQWIWMMGSTATVALAFKYVYTIGNSIRSLLYWFVWRWQDEVIVISFAHASNCRCCAQSCKHSASHAISLITDANHTQPDSDTRTWSNICRSELNCILLNRHRTQTFCCTHGWAFNAFIPALLFMIIIIITPDENHTHLLFYLSQIFSLFSNRAHV